LDFAFSREQRDKVYVQHVMRNQGRRLWPWLHDGAAVCSCEVAAKSVPSQ
jgi:sulfite reductase alpha subunit-like flavoprotein